MLTILRGLSGGKELKLNSNVQVDDIATTSTEANTNADHDLPVNVPSGAVGNPDHDNSLNLNQRVQQEFAAKDLVHDINPAIASPIGINSDLNEPEDTEEDELPGGSTGLKAITTTTETGHNSISNGSTIDEHSFTNMSQSNLAVSKNMKLYQRLSLSSLGFLNLQFGKLSSNEEHREELKAHDVARKSSFLNKRSQRRAKNTALTLRAVLVGRTGDIGKLGETTNSTLKRIKAQLLDPKTASQVIAQLRIMSLSSGSDLMHTQGPIHAVCLEHPDIEVASRHFHQLKSASPNKIDEVLPSIANAGIDSLTMFLRNLHVINLLSSPDFGLGQPGDGDGILSGAVPTAATVINGIEQITPQLMALGYATGKSIIPDHKGVYLPLDRMSIITYWWGLEIAMPEQTMKYLSDAQSIQHSFINFLTALSLIDDGVREIVPFVRYISQFMDFEWNSIKTQDKGKGVVCAATWLMPAALVPRPWDFPDNPAFKPPISTLPVKPNQPSTAPGIISPEVSVGVGTGNGNVEPSTHAPPPSLVVTAATLPRSAAALNDLNFQ